MSEVTVGVDAHMQLHGSLPFSVFSLRKKSGAEVDNSSVKQVYFVFKRKFMTRRDTVRGGCKKSFRTAGRADPDSLLPRSHVKYLSFRDDTDAGFALSDYR